MSQRVLEHFNSCSACQKAAAEYDLPCPEMQEILARESAAERHLLDDTRRTGIFEGESSPMSQRNAVIGESELARLQAENAQLREQRDGMSGLAAKALKENESLLSLVRRLTDALDARCSGEGDVTQIIALLKEAHRAATEER